MLKKAAILGTCILSGYTGCITNINVVEAKTDEINNRNQETMNTYYRDQLNNAEKQIFDLIRNPELWLNGKSFLVPLPDNLTDDVLKKDASVFKIKNALQYEAADIFWVDPEKYGMKIVEENGETYVQVLAVFDYTFFNDSYPANEINYEKMVQKLREDFTAFNKKVKDVAEEMRQKAIKQTPYFLADEINTWLCDHNVYSSDQALGTLDNRRSAFSALMSENNVDSGPVCNGYGYGFKVLADELGLTSVTIRGQVIVQGSSVEHFWNRILMPDGNWYDIDTTWNDSSANQVSLRKNFFLVGSETETQKNDANISPIYKDNHPVIHNIAGTPPQLSKNRYTEIEPVAMIHDRGYTSLQEAINAVKDNEIIPLYENLTLSDTLTVTGNKSFTLDFNGKCITSDKTILHIDNGSTVTIRDRTLSSDSSMNQLTGFIKNGYFGYIIDNNGSVIIESGRAFSKTKLFNGNPYTISEGSQQFYSDKGTILFVKPKDTVIMPTDIKLNQSSLSIKAGNSIQLSAIIAPENTTYKDVTWSSSDHNVASVDQNGNILGISEGTAIITAESYTGKRAFCKVIVSEGQLMNQWEEELTISSWTFGETAAKPSAKSLYGEVRFEYSEQENGIYTSTIPKNAGTWYVKAIVDETDAYTGLESSPVQFEISKKVMKNEDIILPSNLSGAAGTKLSRIALPEGWNWKNQEEILSSAKNQYTAILTLEDTANYDYTNVDGYQKDNTIIRELNVKVSKNVNSFTAPLTISDWTYGDNPNTPFTKAEFGNDKIYYVYSDQADGIYTSAIPSNAGKWFVKAIVDPTDIYTGLESSPVSFTINRKIMTETDFQIPALSKGISRNPLSSINLPEGWIWEDTNALLSTKIKEYPAIFTLTKENVRNNDYSKLAGYQKDNVTGNEVIVRSLYIHVDKKEVNDIPIPENLTGTVKNPLESIILPSGWTWENPSEKISIGDNAYSAIFTLPDEEEYDYTNIIGYEAGKIKKNLTVTGNKIIVDEIEVPEALNGTANNTLSSIVLPIGWSWKNPNEILSTSISSYTAIFTPADDDVYDYSNVAGYQNGKIIRNIKVTVSADSNEWMEEVSLSDWTYGDNPNTPFAKAKFGNDHIYYLYSNTPDGIYTAEVPKNAGTWFVKAVIDETSEYTGLESTPKAFRIHRKTVSDIDIPANLSGTAGSSLSTISLPQGWIWENPNEILSSTTQSAKAILTLDDEENFDYSNVEGYQTNGTVLRELPILVSKNENYWTEIPSIENWTYGESKTPKGASAFGTVEFTYSSSIHGSFDLQPPKNAGNWYMKAKVKGNEVYTSLEMVIPFTIHKAKPIYEIPDNLSGYAGSKLSDIQLPEGFHWENPSTALKKGIESAKAVFTPKDTLNYEIVHTEIPFHVLLQKNKWTIQPNILDTIYGTRFSSTGYSRSGEPYFLYSATINGPYTKEIPENAGTWYAIARVDGDEIYGSLESEPIQFVIKPKILQNVSFNENLQLFDNQTKLQEGIDYTYTIEDKIDFYRYVITLKGNYYGTIVKDVKKEMKKDTIEQEKAEVEKNETADEVKTEKGKTNVETGYNVSAHLYGWLALSSLLIFGLAIFRKRKSK